MSTHVNPVLEKAIITALSSAADIISNRIIAEGVPTTEIMNNMITEALGEAGSALSQKGADMLTVKALEASDSRKANLGIFLGMIKGKCVTLGMRARNVYDLEQLIKSVGPVTSFNLSTIDAMKVVKLTLASLPTKISASLASYAAQGGISKSRILEVFSDFDEEMLIAITGIVEKVVEGVCNALDGSPSGA